VGNQILIVTHANKIRYSLCSIEASNEIVSDFESYLAILKPTKNQSNKNYSLSPSLEKLTETINGLIPKPTSNDNKIIQLYQDQNLPLLPIKSLLYFSYSKHYSSLDSYSICYSPSITIHTKNSWPAHTQNTSRVIIAPSGNLLYGAIEGATSWPDNEYTHRLLDKAATLPSITSNIRNASIMHFCGHLKIDKNYHLNSYLDIAGPEKLTLQRCLENIRFTSNPLVILNACRTASFAENHSV